MVLPNCPCHDSRGPMPVMRVNDAPSHNMPNGFAAGTPGVGGVMMLQHARKRRQRRSSPTTRTPHRATISLPQPARPGHQASVHCSVDQGAIRIRTSCEPHSLLGALKLRSAFSNVAPVVPGSLNAFSVGLQDLVDVVSPPSSRKAPPAHRRPAGSNH
jgi:hypothetical protein